MRKYVFEITRLGWGALKAAGYVTAFYAGMLIGVFAIFTVPLIRENVNPIGFDVVVWDGFESEAVAAWVQAIGTIVALAVAIVAPIYHRQIEAKEAQLSSRRPLKALATALDEELAHFLAAMVFTDITLAQDRKTLEENAGNASQVSKECLESLEAAVGRAGDFDEDVCDLILLNRERIDRWASYLRFILETSGDPTKTQLHHYGVMEFSGRRDAIMKFVSEFRRVLERYHPSGYTPYGNILDQS